MKILVDENIPAMTVRSLREHGHDVKDIRGTEREGQSDADLWVFCQSEQRLLITTDKGFAQNRNEIHSGVLIVRLRQPNRRRIHEKVMEMMRLTREKEWQGLTIVVQDRFHRTWTGKKRKAGKPKGMV